MRDVKRLLKKLKRMKIGVLMGGNSSERVISLQSGKNVLEALIGLGYKAVPVDFKGISSFGFNSAGKSRIFDIAFIALHGSDGEDGKVQGILSIAGIRYTGSGVLASALAMDKIKAKKVFNVAGIPTPEFEVIEDFKNVENKRFGFPVVVKPANQGSTVGISIVESEIKLGNAVRKARQYEPYVFLERYVNGRELTVGVLEDKVLPVIEIMPKNRFYDYESKYAKGGSVHVVPAKISALEAEQAQELALAVHNAIGCRDFSRVDMILSSEGIYVLEVNTIPGFTRTSLLPDAAKACGISFDKLVEKMLLLALKHED